MAAKIVVGKGVGKQMTRSRWFQKEAAFLKFSSHEFGEQMI